MTSAVERGMHPVRSVLLFVGVACCVSFAVFAGHSLSTHESKPVLVGTGFLVLGAVLLFLYDRTGKAAV
jgi:hypothetical protein